ncbi:MAG: hypothetical protein ABII89_07895 [Candidatus Omnitrophota bacterium]
MPAQPKTADDFIVIEAPSGRIRKITGQQIANLKDQPGILFSERSTKNLAAGQIEVVVPAELGGGYIIGATPALASAFNKTGITAGLVPERIIRSLLEIFGMSKITITLAEILILVLDRFSR